MEKTQRKRFFHINHNVNELLSSCNWTINFTYFILYTDHSIVNRDNIWWMYANQSIFASVRARLDVQTARQIESIKRFPSFFRRENYKHFSNIKNFQSILLQTSFLHKGYASVTLLITDFSMVIFTFITNIYSLYTYSCFFNVYESVH